MIKFLLITVIAILSIVGCASKETETPVEAIQAIIKFYEAQDFDSLIRTRYAEIFKAENEEQIQLIIDRFKTRFQNEDKLNEAIDTYKTVLHINPELLENNTVAVFRLNNGFIKLSRMPNGKWGFHL